jgi:hypothetical protein
MIVCIFKEKVIFVGRLLDGKLGYANQISSIFWLILSLLGTYGSDRLGLGAPPHPDSGFLFFWLAGLSLAG